MGEHGYLSIVLHAHLPFVRHPEYDEFLEEDWFFEAVIETYVPLLEVFDRLVRDGVDFRVTMSLSPTLLAMLVDPLLQYRVIRHINKLIELAAREVERTRWQPEFNELALMYHHRLTRARHVFAEQYHHNLVEAFRRFQDLGVLEVVTCAATHGYLPLMAVNMNAVRGQIGTAVRHYEKCLGRRPNGIWLPECGYETGIDEILREFDLRFFFTDAHGLLHASPRPKYGVFAPILCPTGVAAFGRDLESSKQVWSAQEGYPGDYDYRDFYRDVGFDLDYDYVRPYIHHLGIRKMTGIKYYRITGQTDHKEPYVPARAREKAAAHAGNFMFNREKQCEHLHGFMGRKPIIVAPYDAELFGHWWYEGPDWLECLCRKVYYDQENVSLITPSEYLTRHPRIQVSTPSMSSWGWKGYSEVWLEGSNDWIYRHLYRAAQRMVELARTHRDTDNELTRRALNQAARELLLGQSSDWAFIMKGGTVVEYAVKRTKEHVLRFTRLYRQIRSNQIDEWWLADIESKDNLFPDIDFRSYA
jgi:1,4-alpha-glucan branching enzyme